MNTTKRPSSYESQPDRCDYLYELLMAQDREGRKYYIEHEEEELQLDAEFDNKGLLRNLTISTPI